MTELIVPTRRGFLLGLGTTFVVAPAIIRTIRLMPIRPVPAIFIPPEVYNPTGEMARLNGQFWVGVDQIVKNPPDLLQQMEAIEQKFGWRHFDGLTEYHPEWFDKLGFVKTPERVWAEHLVGLIEED